MMVMVTVLGTSGALLVTGCGDAAEPPANSASPEQPTAVDHQPTSIGPADESEVPQHWDTAADTLVTSAAQLSDSQRLEALRLTASATAEPATCTRDEVTAELEYLDAAMGHRYGTITVTNGSETDCTLIGYPGVGGYGQWGNPFVLEAEQVAFTQSWRHQPEPFEPTQVRLEPGQSAAVAVEWTGALAGAESEPLDTLLLQTAQQAPPVVVETAGERSPDIGMFSTVRIGPFEVAEAVSATD